MKSQGNWRRLRALARTNPTLRSALYPLRKVRGVVVARARAPRVRLVQRIGSQLVEPCVRVPDFRGQFHMDARSDTFKRILLNGEYESTIVRNIVDHVDPTRDCIDIGANVGLYSVLLAQLCPGQRVLAVEPSIEALDFLHRNLELNGVADSVAVHAGAAGAAEATMSLQHVRGKSEYSTLSALTHVSIRQESASALEAVVDVTTADHLVEHSRLDPGFIKIDVEGLESSVITGAAKTIEKYRPVLLVEAEEHLLAASGSSREELHDAIAKHRYSILEAETLDVWRPSTSSYMMLCLPHE